MPRGERRIHGPPGQRSPTSQKLRDKRCLSPRTSHSSLDDSWEEKLQAFIAEVEGNTLDHTAMEHSARRNGRHALWGFSAETPKASHDAKPRSRRGRARATFATLQSMSGCRRHHPHRLLPFRLGRTGRVSAESETSRGLVP